MLSWYPPGVADDHGGPTEDLVPAVMDAAHRHSIKVTGETAGLCLVSDVTIDIFTFSAIIPVGSVYMIAS